MNLLDGSNGSSFDSLLSTLHTFHPLFVINYAVGFYVGQLIIFAEHWIVYSTVFAMACCYAVSTYLMAIPRAYSAYNPSVRIFASFFYCHHGETFTHPQLLKQQLAEHDAAQAVGWKTWARRNGLTLDVVHVLAPITFYVSQFVLWPQCNVVASGTLLTLT